MGERRFKLPSNRGVVRFEEKVLKHMYRFAQVRYYQTEAGGQLFSPAPERSDVLIAIATGPYPSDSRSRYGFHLDLGTANDDRNKKFDDGYHAVGLWHTHPEPNPSPSGRDRDTVLEFLKACNGEMEGFLLAIVGNKGKPPNMTVWMASSGSFQPWVRLEEL